MFKHLKLNTKFILSVSILIVLVVLGIGAMVIYSENRMLRSEMEAQHKQLAKQLAQVCEESLLQDDLILFNYFKGLKSERGFISAGLVDLKGRIQIFSDRALMGAALSSPQEEKAVNAESLFRQEYRTKDGQSVVDYAVPVNFGQGRAGVARLIFNKDQLDAFVRDSLTRTARTVGGISLIAFALGLIGALALSRTLVSPIQKVVGGMRDVAGGRLDPLPSLERGDELGWMMDELNRTIGKLKELDDMKREFTASVTHELRSPLTAIEQLIEHSLEETYGPLSGDLRETLLMVKNNSTRLKTFVDDLLTTAKIESRRIDVFLEKYDVKEVLKEAQKFYGPVAKQKGLDLKLNTPDGPVVAWADRQKTAQILSNLISNAIKFTEKGAVTIAAGEEGSEVRVSVSDSGVGIPPSDLGKIFEKFYRVASTSKKVKGTGLGLSIVKSFLELQGGRITVQNNPDHGACFSFFLPKKGVPASI